jgi:hypothetical protein
MYLPVKYDDIPYREKYKVRNEYIKQQKGRCAHCGNELKGKPTQEVLDKRLDLDLFPPGFLTHPVHLHHNHDTGLTIGAIHAYCNGVLWQYHGE